MPLFFCCYRRCYLADKSADIVFVTHWENLQNRTEYRQIYGRNSKPAAARRKVA
jgi:hypothetical protein